MTKQAELSLLLKRIRACDICADVLPHTPRPVLRASTSARLLIVGQAPGTKVHQTGIPFNDPSGDRLRKWLMMDRELFYDESRIAIVPMGFCYPGKGKSGDLPPRKECASEWRKPLSELMPNIRLTLLVGQYAQQYYLGTRYASLTEAVRDWPNLLPSYFPTPHPSPRNQLWLKRNPWFEIQAVPALREEVSRVLGN